MTGATPNHMAWPARLPLIAILRGIRPDEVHAHAEALIDGGFEFVEVPTNSPAWSDSVRVLADAFGARVVVGAGTITTLAHVDALVAARGQLMVTPNTDPALIRAAAARGLLTAIGCATASEAFAALAAGAHALKLFPASVLGTAQVSALRTVLPEGTPLLAVGGITAANLAGFVKAGCLGVGLGGELYRAGQTPEVTAAHAQAFMAAWRQIAGDP